jgi:formate/nitrite transporter FocA (FNT family)
MTPTSDPNMKPFRQHTLREPEVAPSDKPKEVREVIREQINKEMKEYRKSTFELAMSSLAAGLEIGFSLFTMGILYTLFSGQVSHSALHIMLSLGYAVGFLFVIIGRSELFTEHTTLAIMPVLDGVVPVKKLFYIWGVVFAGNIIGGWIIGIILSYIGPHMGIISKDAFYELAYMTIRFDWKTIFVSGILAGWLMGLLSWLVTSSQETISRIVVVLLVTSLIGLGSLHHSIAGSVEVFTGMITSGKIGWGDYITFEINAVIGNLIGGCVFVAVLKFSMTRFRS